MKHISYLILIGVFSTSVSAEVYKCTDANGKKVYRSLPCADGFNNEAVDLKTGSVVDLDALQKQQELKRLEEEAKLEKERLAQQQEALRKLALEKAVNEESEINQQLIKSNPTQYSPFAIPPYKFGKLNSLVKQFENRLPEIEKFRRVAAKKSLATDQCVRVEAVELNEKSNTTGLVFLVDCKSGKSFYYNEKELTP